MKVIDLLNKIANGEEIPKRIRLADNEYCYEIRDKFGIDYRRINTTNHYLSVDIISFIHLNDEVEIIEEDKKIEKIDVNHLQQIKKWKRAKILGNKINEIIDYLEEKE